MHRAHIPSLPWNELHSPSRKFHSFTQNISAALGARFRDQPGETHPFDLQVRRVPPGAAICPYHSHAAQWEMFFVIRGSGTVRVNGERHAIAPGDVFIHPPGVAHQTINSGTEDLEVYIIADNPTVEICHYPDSNKWGISSHRKYFRMVEVDYFDGEGEAPPSAPPPTPVSAPTPPAPFKKINVADLPWEEWSSPKKKFRAFSKGLSVALGEKYNAPIEAGGHPFDLELQRIAPGECGCPFHSHAAQSEMYLITRGRAIMRAGTEHHELVVGDVTLHPPHDAHQIRNPGPDDLEFLLIADNPPVDYWFYPDSQKWGLREPRMFFRPTPLDYFDGEE